MTPFVSGEKKSRAYPMDEYEENLLRGLQRNVNRFQIHLAALPVTILFR